MHTRTHAHAYAHTHFHLPRDSDLVHWEGALGLVFFENSIGDSDTSILVEDTAIENFGILFST